MWLIAIDEAGYGPKLGPLVLAATLWHHPDPATATSSRPSGSSRREETGSVDRITPDPFAPIAAPVRVGDTLIRVDDSKRIFRSGSRGVLSQIVSVAHRVCNRSEPTLAARLPSLIAPDWKSVKNNPWLASMLDVSNPAYEFAPAAETQTAVKQWGHCSWKLRDVAARMIDAKTFNRYCDGRDSGDEEKIVPRGNKSDLLGETSIRLAADLLDRVRDSEAGLPANEHVQVFFDRHGGRRYYAGVIQQFFDCESVKILGESKMQSVYETVRHGQPVRLHFTVKGDAHIPVALSSLHAKYLREVAMGSLNDYFRAAMRRVMKPNAGKYDLDSALEFRVTAGYPVDADRFIAMIRPAMEAEGIVDRDLIRCR